MAHYRTDDVRIEQGDELLAPMQVMRELPATERSEQATFEGRKAVHDILRGADDRLLVVVGPCSIHDYEGGTRLRDAACGRARTPEARPGYRDARVFREAAHHGRLEGLHQRPAPGRDLRHQRGDSPRAQAASARSTSSAFPAGHGVPRPHLAAVHRRPDRVGRDRRAHDGIAIAPAARLGTLVPRGIQERHRRQHPHRRRCHQGGRARATISSPSPSRATSRCSRPRATRIAT